LILRHPVLLVATAGLLINILIASHLKSYSLKYAPPFLVSCNPAVHENLCCFTILFGCLHLVWSRFLIWNLLILRRPLKLQNVTLHPVIPAIDLEAKDRLSEGIWSNKRL
jgi:hypothetical protein